MSLSYIIFNKLGNIIPLKVVPVIVSDSIKTMDTVAQQSETLSTFIIPKNSTSFERFCVFYSAAWLPHFPVLTFNTNNNL